MTHARAIQWHNIIIIIIIIIMSKYAFSYVIIIFESDGRRNNVDPIEDTVLRARTR